MSLIQRAKADTTPGAAYYEITAIPNSEIATFDIGVRLELLDYLCLFEAQWRKAIAIANDMINDEERGVYSPISVEKDYPIRFGNYLFLLNSLPRVEDDGTFSFNGKMLNARAGVVYYAQKGVPAAQYWAAVYFDRYGHLPTMYTLDEAYRYLTSAAESGIAMARTEFERIARKHGDCRHCGGRFKGFFTVKCERCSRKKDY